MPHPAHHHLFDQVGITQAGKNKQNRHTRVGMRAFVQVMLPITKVREIKSLEKPLSAWSKTA